MEEVKIESYLVSKEINMSHFCEKLRKTIWSAINDDKCFWKTVRLFFLTINAVF